MKGFVKCIIAGVIIAIIGGAIVLGTLAYNGWKIKKPEFEMRTYTATDDNREVNLEIGAGEVEVVFSDEEKISVEYPSADLFRTEISEKNGTFRYEAKIKRMWIWGNWDIPKTVIKLPENTEFAFNLDIELNAGTVTLASGSFGNVEIEVNAGRLAVNDSSCTKFDGEVHAGALEINRLICDKFDGSVSAGKLEVKSLDCPDISADVSAGACIIAVNGAKADYSIKTDVSAGSCNVSDQSGGTGKKIDVDCSAGKIEISFAG